MVEVQVSVDDDVDVFGRTSARGEIRKELRRLSVKLHHALGKFMAHASRHQHGVFSSTNEKRVKPSSDIVSLVGGYLARPHDFRDDAEESSAIERVGCLSKNRQFEIAQ